MKVFLLLIVTLTVAMMLSPTEAHARRGRKSRRSGASQSACASGNCQLSQSPTPAVSVEVEVGNVEVEVTAGKKFCCTDLSCSKCVVETQTLALINKCRSRQGLRAFRRSARMITGCRRHSLRQARSGMHHASNLEGARGENVAMGQRSPQEVVNSWMNSSGHRALILGSGTQVGVAVSGNAWTMRTQ